ncbi:MAG: hypothetical protein IJ817_00980 [Clostridia bacterium]|nr:hypothetical protein [Clostridia bacterium]
MVSEAAATEKVIRRGKNSLMGRYDVKNPTVPIHKRSVPIKQELSIFSVKLFVSS